VTPTTIDLAAALKDAARLRPEFAEFVKVEYARWEGIVRNAGVVKE